MQQEPIIQHGAQLANSEIKKIADRVASTVILAAEKVSVEKDYKPAAGTFESILQERLNTFPDRKKSDIVKRVKPIYSASQDIRTALYGDLGAINLESVDSVEMEANRMAPVEINRGLLGMWTPPPGAELAAEELASMASQQTEVFNIDEVLAIDSVTGDGAIFSEVGVAADADEGMDDFEPQAVTDKLGLWIRRVKCVDETNPEFWGSDEIALGGSSVDETGDLKSIAEVRIGGGFDDGDAKSYSPHWRWHWFNLREGGSNWPKSYFLTFVLAEKDMGGLSNFLQKLWDKVKSQVLAAITKAVSGGTSPWVGPLGPVIGAAVSYAVNKIVEWFIKSWKDDIFPPSTVSCTLPSYGARWTVNGRRSTSSNVRRAHFYGHGGHYYIEYYWKLFA